MILRDIRFALRSLGKNPGFAVTSIVVLALSIGGNTAMFTVIRAVLLKPLDYRDPDALVRMAGGGTPTRLREMQAGARSFTAIGAFTGQENVTLSGGAEPEVLTGVRVSANFLEIIGIAPLLGRGFRPEEDSAGGAPVAMISADLWRRRFGGSSQAIGRAATLESTPHTIIGVLPPRFQFPFAGVDVWMTAPAEWPLMTPQSRALSPFLSIFGRLKPGVNLEQANAELQVIRRQYKAAHPSMLDAKPKAPEAMALKDELLADVHAMLWMLFGAVGFVLLIACANVASLLLARATARSREFAVRAALGAGRARLIGQLLAESAVLSAAGGALGVLLAAWSLRALPNITALELPRASEIHLDWMAPAFAALLSIATGMLFGLAPALGASQPDLIRVLRSSGADRSQAGGRFNSRSLLVVGQVALSVVLLIGAALLMESVARLRSVDTGFNPAKLLTMRISLSLARYDTERKRNSFFDELLLRMGSAPGVRSAAAAMTLPMMGFAGTPVQDAGMPPLKLNERPIATVLTVTPGYFRTLEIPVKRGREFGERDKAEAQRVAIIDEALARHFWPAYPAGPDPVGQRLLIGGVNPKPAEIVGIVGEVRQNLENNAWPDTVYVAFTQNPPSSAMLAVRAAGDPHSIAKDALKLVQALNRDQAIAEVRTMDELVEAQVGQRRLLTLLLGSFAGVALLLALIGIYGVIAYSVAQRTQEVGIRRALGAQQGDILRLVIGEGMVFAAAGVAVGAGGAFALTRVMKTMLFHVSATDPATFAGMALLFLAVSAIASYIPARRAARIDPMAALRV